MTESHSPTARTLVYLVTALAGVAALLLLVFGGSDPEGERAPEIATAATPSDPPPEPARRAPVIPPLPARPTPAPEPDATEEPDPRPVHEVSGAGPHTLPSGGTFVFGPGALPADVPIRFHLPLPDEAADPEAPHPVRVLAPDGRSMFFDLLITEEGLVLQLPTLWLTPGRYVVEVQTVEQTHFPLRRWAIEIAGP